MQPRKRTVVYLDARLHRALRLRSKATECTTSEVIADALRQAFAQEARDIEGAKARKRGPKLSLDAVGARLKRRPKR